MDLRSEMMQAMLDCGLEVEAHHHEVASGGQCEIDLRYQPLVTMADWMQIYKYCVRNVARAAQQDGDVHAQAAVRRQRQRHARAFLVLEERRAAVRRRRLCGAVRQAQYAIGGILKHAPALLALTSPTTNSYKRLVPGYEAPVNLVYSQRNRSAACRIPMYSQSPKAKRVEFRCPDPTCNPYLAFAAITMAAIDGIQNKLSRASRSTRTCIRCRPKSWPRFARRPRSLDEALMRLEKDYDFLLKGDVFTADVIDTWINYKRQNEVDAIRLRPHPYEFCLYFDA